MSVPVKLSYNIGFTEGAESRSLWVLDLITPLPARPVQKDHQMIVQTPNALWFGSTVSLRKDTPRLRSLSRGATLKIRILPLTRFPASGPGGGLFLSLPTRHSGVLPGKHSVRSPIL